MDETTKKKYILLAEFLHKTLGSEYEIILHDFEDEKHSIIFLANEHISGRSKENPFTDSTFDFIRDKTAIDNDYVISHKGITQNNKVIRSSSLFIKDDNNKLIGMLCINFDGSKYVNLAKNILQLTNMENASIENERLHHYDFIDNTPNDIIEVAENLLDDALDYSDIPVGRLNQEEKIDIVRKLNNKGVFRLKGAVTEVAEKLGVSEATLYRYIRIASKDK